MVAKRTIFLYFVSYPVKSYNSASDLAKPEDLISLFLFFFIYIINDPF